MDQRSSKMMRSAFIKSAQLAFVAVGCAIGFMVSPLAARNVEVSFKANDGDLIVTGELRQMSRAGFVLATKTGNVTVLPKNVTCISKACPVIGQQPSVQAPNEMSRISLSSLDKSIVVDGSLRDVSDQQYLLEVSGLGLISFERRGLRCSGPGCLVTAGMLIPIEAPVEPLQIVGSSDLTHGVLATLLEGYGEMGSGGGKHARLSANTYVMDMGVKAGTFFVGGTGPSAAFGALAAGAADFAITRRQPNPSEIAAFAIAELPDLRGSPYETILATEDLVIVTHPDLGISELTISQISSIYRGEVSNWAVFGGPDQTITAVTREVGADARTVFGDVIFDDENMRSERGVETVGSTAEMKAVLARDQFSIGYVWQTHSAGLNAVNVLGSCGLSARNDPFALKAGDALFGAQTYLYRSPKTVNEAANGLSDYAASRGARDALGLVGLVDTEIVRMPVADGHGSFDTSMLKDGLEKQKAEQYLAVLGEWDRLSVTFRPNIKEEPLGQSGNADFARLAEYLDAHSSDVEIAVVGFASRVDDFASTLAASEAFAKSVADEIAKNVNDRVGIRHMGFGSLMPIFCDDDARGRSLNQRAEVWVRKGVE